MHGTNRRVCRIAANQMLALLPGVRVDRPVSRTGAGGGVNEDFPFTVKQVAHHCREAAHLRPGSGLGLVTSRFKRSRATCGAVVARFGTSDVTWPMEGDTIGRWLRLRAFFVHTAGQRFAGLTVWQAGRAGACLCSGTTSGQAEHQTRVVACPSWPLRLTADTPSDPCPCRGLGRRKRYTLIK